MNGATSYIIVAVEGFMTVLQTDILLYRTLLQICTFQCKYSLTYFNRNKNIVI